MLAKKRGRPPSFAHRDREKAIETLQYIAEGALARKRWNEAVSEHVSKRKAWHAKRGKGRTYRERQRAFKEWCYAHMSSGALVYVFWKGKRCLYVGRTQKGGARPASHFEKRSFSPVTRIDVYAASGVRTVAMLECLATHHFQPRNNRIRPSVRARTTGCPICALQKDIEDEVKGLFPLMPGRHRQSHRHARSKRRTRSRPKSVRAPSFPFPLR